jgi:hypothetical protein
MMACYSLHTEVGGTPYVPMNRRSLASTCRALPRRCRQLSWCVRAEFSVSMNIHGRQVNSAEPSARMSTIASYALRGCPTRRRPGALLVGTPIPY